MGTDFNLYVDTTQLLVLDGVTDDENEVISDATVTVMIWAVPGNIPITVDENQNPAPIELQPGDAEGTYIGIKSAALPLVAGKNYAIEFKAESGDLQMTKRPVRRARYLT